MVDRRLALRAEPRHAHGSRAALRAVDGVPEHEPAALPPARAAICLAAHRHGGLRMVRTQPVGGHHGRARGGAGTAPATQARTLAPGPGSGVHLRGHGRHGRDGSIQRAARTARGSGLAGAPPRRRGRGRHRARCAHRAQAVSRVVRARIPAGTSSAVDGLHRRRRGGELYPGRTDFRRRATPRMGADDGRHQLGLGCDERVGSGTVQSALRGSAVLRAARTRRMAGAAGLVGFYRNHWLVHPPDRHPQPGPRVCVDGTRRAADFAARVGLLPTGWHCQAAWRSGAVEHRSWHSRAWH